MSAAKIINLLIAHTMNYSKLNAKLRGIYRRFEKAVVCISELTHHELYNSRHEVSVLARAVFITMLMKHGLSERAISILSGMSRQRVNSLKNSASFRLKNLAARILMEEVERYLAEEDV